MHHHIILALSERAQGAAAAAQDLATSGIPQGALHLAEEDGQSAWDWLGRYDVPRETVGRPRRSTGGAATLVMRAAEADLTRVLAILDRNRALSTEDLDSDLGGTEAELHPPNSAV